MNRIEFWIKILAAYLVCGAHEQDGVVKEDKWPSFQELTKFGGSPFINRASRTTRKYLPEAMGGGVAVLDYDGDGLLGAC